MYSWSWDLFLTHRGPSNPDLHYPISPGGEGHVAHGLAVALAFPAGGAALECLRRAPIVGWSSFTALAGARPGTSDRGTDQGQLSIMTRHQRRYPILRGDRPAPSCGEDVNMQAGGGYRPGGNGMRCLVCSSTAMMSAV